LVLVFQKKTAAKMSSLLYYMYWYTYTYRHTEAILGSPNTFVGITKALFGSFKTMLGCATSCRVALMPVLQPQSLGGQFQASEGWLTVPGWHSNSLFWIALNPCSAAWCSSTCVWGCFMWVWGWL